MTDFVQGQLRVRFRFGTLWPMLEIFFHVFIYRKLSSPPQALRLRARLDTKWKKTTKKKLKIRAEFMTSVSYRPEVIRVAVCSVIRVGCRMYGWKKEVTKIFMNSSRDSDASAGGRGPPSSAKF